MKMNWKSLEINAMRISDIFEKHPNFEYAAFLATEYITNKVLGGAENEEDLTEADFDMVWALEGFNKSFGFTYSEYEGYQYWLKF